MKAQPMASCILTEDSGTFEVAELRILSQLEIQSAGRATDSILEWTKLQSWSAD